jgi:hypothetical protein
MRPRAPTLPPAEPAPMQPRAPGPVHRDAEEPPAPARRAAREATPGELPPRRLAPTVPPPVIVRLPAATVVAAPVPAEARRAAPLREQPDARPVATGLRPSVQPLPAVRPVTPARREPPPLPPAAPQAPAIHVSIGRIEVRASAPPGPRARPGSPPPAERLEDYLRARKDRP